MLLSLPELIKKYSLRISGVIHVGAHFGEEVPEYAHAGIKNIILIEPCAPAYRKMENKFAGHHHILMYNCACAAVDGEATMFTETANHGQSNSLLQPMRHLQHYPDIQFKGTEQVKVLRLDTLMASVANESRYNMLNIDVQGAEGAVIIGGRYTLDHIDYVYTEVNDDAAQLYKNATKVSELDQLLKEFTRVETSWTQQGWGDALYIRTTKIKGL
jgi:FkbM family methyltransferase